MQYNEFLSKFNIRLNEQQNAAVQRVQGATLLLAVPGSGKTTVIVSHLGYMLYCLDIAPENILTMTYTVAATNDMRKRFRRVFGDEYADKLEFRTINGVCQRILMYKYKHLPRILSDESSVSRIVAQALHAVFGEYPNDRDIADYALHIAYAKNMMLPPQERMKRARKFEEVFQAYTRILRENRWMDYDDQLVLAYDALSNDEALRTHFHTTYRYINVDEAQDTSLIQHKIIQLLAGRDGNIFMVGDEDQSIYGFRAAYPQALMSFVNDYDNAVTLLMEQNYRSDGCIVQTANKFIKRNAQRHNKEMFTDKGDGKPIKYTYIKERTKQPGYLLDALTASESQDIAVLYRNNDSIIPLIDLLSKRGIPYKHRGAETLFFSTPVVSDIIDLINLSEDMRRSEEFLRVYYKMGISLRKDIVESVLGAKNPDDTVFQALIGSPAVPEHVRKKLYVMERLVIDIYRNHTDDAIDYIIDRVGYGRWLERRKTESTALMILRMLAGQNRTISTFVRRMGELKAIIGQGGAQDAAITLSTIHSSKGLEYDDVILFDLCEGVFPSMDAKKDDNIREEENRLFYVGMTRARHGLECVYQTTEFVTGLMTPSDSHRYEHPLIHPPVKSVETFEVGDRVSHAQFGVGVVVGVGVDTVTVSFGKRGTKQILTTMPVLTLLD